MRLRALGIVLGFALAASGALAQVSAPANKPAEKQEGDLVTSLSRDVVLIQSTFTGETLALFGVIAKPPEGNSGYDVVVTVRGPRGAVAVRRKERWGPLWLNLDSRRYIAIPSFIAVLSNRNIPSIASAEVREDLRIGVTTLIPAQTAARGNDPDFRAALERIRANQGLFFEDEEAVKMISPNVFQASIALPGIAPIGTYNIEAVVFNGGAVVAAKSLSFVVDKSDIERVVTRAAHVYPLAYGIFTSLIALFFGWLASVIFRRD